MLFKIWNLCRISQIWHCQRGINFKHFNLLDIFWDKAKPWCRQFNAKSFTFAIQPFTSLIVLCCPLKCVYNVGWYLTETNSIKHSWYLAKFRRKVRLFSKYFDSHIYSWMPASNHQKEKKQFPLVCDTLQTERFKHAPKLNWFYPYLVVYLLFVSKS